MASRRSYGPSPLGPQTPQGSTVDQPPLGGKPYLIEWHSVGRLEVLGWDARLQLAIEAAFLAELRRRNPLRQVLTTVVDPGGELAAASNPRSHWVTRPRMDFKFPATYPQPWWWKADGTLPTIPSPPALASASVSAYEVVVGARMTHELASDLRSILSRTPAGTDAFSRGAGFWFRPFIDALALEEERVLIAGAGTNDDPVLGLANVTGLPTFDATGLSVLDALTKAIGQLRRAGREPTYAIIGPSAEEAIRTTKDTAGSYVFSPAANLRVSGVPVVVSHAIPSGTSTFAFVGDFEGVGLFIRPIVDGELRKELEVGVSGDEHFATDEVTLRVRERIGLIALPGVSLGGIRKLINVNAP